MTLGETKFGCKIELSKTGGITISIRDLSQPEQVYKLVQMTNDSLVIKTNKLTSSATITQTESSVVTEVKDNQGSTKIEQGPEEVKVTCKKWTVDAETITMTSSQDTSLTASGACTITSTKDLKAETQAACTLKSTGAMTLDATGAQRDIGAGLSDRRLCFAQIRPTTLFCLPLIQLPQLALGASFELLRDAVERGQCDVREFIERLPKDALR